MKTSSAPTLGGPSLMVTFTVLMLTILSLLTLVQAQNDQRLAERSAENVRAYYAAELKAQETLAKLRAGEPVPGVTDADGFLTLTFPVSRFQTLYVTVDAETRDVIRWQTAAHPDAPNETLPVWPG